MGETEYRLARHGGRFCVVWYEEGRRRRCSLGTTDRALAETNLIEFKRAHTARLRQEPLTVGEIFNGYMDTLKGRSAYGRCGFAGRRLSSVFFDLSPGHRVTARAEDYLLNRSKRVGAGTVHVELGYLRAALRYAEKQGWIVKAPYIPLPQKPPPKDHRLTREEARRLIDGAKMPHVRLFIVLAIATAGRAAALLDLTWDRVLFDRGRINLGNPDRDRTRKGRAIVPMNTMAHKALTEAKAAALTEYVIEYGGKRVLSVKKGVAAAARRAGVKCSPHVLRHTAACLMAEDGVPIQEIAAFLGHSNITTTWRTYAKFSPDYLQKAARSLEL